MLFLQYSRQPAAFFSQNNNIKMLKKFFVSKLNKCTVCEFYRINSILFEKRLWHFNKVTGFASKNLIMVKNSSIIKFKTFLTKRFIE